MKKIIIFSILTICFLMRMQGMTQNVYNLVYDLYFQLILYPEHGDQLISKNIALFDRQFYSCLLIVRQKAQRAAQEHSAICNAHVNPHQRARCEQNNEGAKIYRWTNEIQSVCQGHILWSQSITGSAAIMGKLELERLSPGQYEQIVRRTLPQWRPLFLCQ